MQAIRRTFILSVTCLTLLFGVVGCGFDTEGNPNPDDDGVTRRFLMGVTSQPYDIAVDAVNDNYTRINARSDVIVHQFRDGIPWQEAFDDEELPAALLADVRDKVSQSTGQEIILSVEVTNAQRDGIIGTWSEDGVIESQSPWDSRSFDSEEVIQAYTNYAIKLIDEFDADYFIYGEEISDLALSDEQNSTQEFDAFVIFARQVYDNIKEQKPDVEVMFSVALRSPNSSQTSTILSQLTRITDSTDIVGLSVYPYRNFTHSNLRNPEALPSDWLSQARVIAGNKPLAITQTGWVAETLTLEEENFTIEGTEAFQEAYVEALLLEANRFELEFVVWYTAVDYDTFWTDTLMQDEDELSRRDTGLFDQTLTARAGLMLWDDFFARTIQ